LFRGGKGLCPLFGALIVGGLISHNATQPLQTAPFPFINFNNCWYNFSEVESMGILAMGSILRPRITL